MEKVNLPAAEVQGASLRAARAEGVEEELTRQERVDLRHDLLKQAGGDWLKFQARAVQLYGAAAGIMCRELLFWDDKGDDPSGGWTYMTKQGSQHSCEERTGLSPKSQDGGRKRLEDAGVLEVERRARRNKEGKVVHPSPVLHYRLKLPELLDQMGKDPEALKQEFKCADADARTSRSVDSNTPIGTPDEADADVRVRGSRASGTPIRSFEHAVTGPPYTEGTSEVTPEATPEKTSEETTQGTPEGADGAPRRSAPRRPPGQDNEHRAGERRLRKDSPVLLEIIEMIEAAGDGRSEDEHLDALCRLHGILPVHRNRFRAYVRQALEELQARNGAA